MGPAHNNNPDQAAGNAEDSCADVVVAQVVPAAFAIVLAVVALAALVDADVAPVVGAAAAWVVAYAGAAQTCWLVALNVPLSALIGHVVWIVWRREPPAVRWSRNLLQTGRSVLEPSLLLMSLLVQQSTGIILSWGTGNSQQVRRLILGMRRDGLSLMPRLEGSWHEARGK